MDKLLIWIFIFLLLGTFIFSEHPIVLQARTTTYKTLTYFLPGWCYINIPGITCSDTRITTTGIALTVKNNLPSFGKKNNNLYTFIASIPTCSTPVAAHEGLLNNEAETFIFRNCTLPTLGTHWQSTLNITYTEGIPPYTIYHYQKGYISGTINY